MTTAKEKYYELKKQTDKYFEGFRDPIHDYVTELEQELKDSELRRKDLLTSLQRVNVQITELEQQGEESKKAIDFYYKFILKEFKKVCPTK